MSLRVAINGMGVIGRELFRTLFGKDGIEIVAINDMAFPDNIAYLLKHDSVYHNIGWEKYRDAISVSEHSITVGGKEIPFSRETDVANWALGEMRIDVVLECTGELGSKDKMQAFINAGARKVISCYSAGNDLPTIAFGVNQSTATNNYNIIAFAEMETQVLANVLKHLNTDFGIETGVCKAFRPYANSQPTMDSFNTKAFARGRAAAWNITPLSDAAAKSIGLVVPELNGKVTGFAYRAPVINGGIMDICVILKEDVSATQINAALKDAASKSMGYSEEYLCSSDALGFENPQILADKTLTMYCVESRTLANISIVYDGIRGYCLQLKRFLEWSMETPDSWLN